MPLHRFGAAFRAAEPSPRSQADRRIAAHGGSKTRVNPLLVTGH